MKKLFDIPLHKRWQDNHLAILQIFAALDINIKVQTVIFFYSIAFSKNGNGHESYVKSDFKDMLGLPASQVARQIGYLSDEDHTGKPGLGLIDITKNENGRMVSFLLSEKGLKLKEIVAEIESINKLGQHQKVSDAIQKGLSNNIFGELETPRWDFFKI